MLSNSAARVSTCPAMTSSSLLAHSHSSGNFSPFLPSVRQKRLAKAGAISSDAGRDEMPSSSADTKRSLAAILDVPRIIWRQTLRPLSDFGFGKRSIWEGGVGLFLVSGTMLFALSLIWLRGFHLRFKFRKYLSVFEFSQASGICTGTPVRIRGVTVGSVIRVNPSLRCIEAVVEIEDDKTIIPKNSRIEVNQSGLLMESMIDITPKDPIPSPSVGPLSPECVNEGLIVCDKQNIKGHSGVSLDELVGIYTRLGREAEQIGITNTYSMIERVSSVVEEARPLLTKMTAMAEDVQPLLSKIHDGRLLEEVEILTKSLTQACEDLRRVHSSMMAPDSMELIHNSVSSLVSTLKNMESISSDIVGLTGDETTTRNLKSLIKTLSRLL